jgi:hypothetical protein
VGITSDLPNERVLEDPEGRFGSSIGTIEISYPGHPSHDYCSDSIVETSMAPTNVATWRNLLMQMKILQRNLQDSFSQLIIDK